ncbi:MAG: hypothetical protein HY302_06900 [Opitutae bacterium]|nr:hypothetical protein [Opitutae bacterium]
MAAAAEAEAPVGPSAEEEAAFLSEQSFQEAASAPLSVAAPAEPEEPAGALPPLAELVNRIPAPVRGLMEELFRAKFVTVKRVPKSALKN